MATLEITIHGLCLFVPYNNAMYIVMPETGGPVHKHSAMIQIDHKYYFSGDPRHIIPIDTFQLELAGTGGSGATPDFACGVVNITDFSGLRVPEGSLLRNDFGAVDSRVVLTDGSMSKPQEIACWRLPVTGQNAGMTDEIVWRIPLATSPARVELLLSDLQSGSGSGTSLVTLQSVNDLIEFEIHHHVVGLDTPFGGQPNEPPPHFAGFYRLLENSFSDLPGYAPGSCACTDVKVVGTDAALFPDTSTIYTCMVAGAAPGP